MGSEEVAAESKKEPVSEKKAEKKDPSVEEAKEKAAETLGEVPPSPYADDATGESKKKKKKKDVETAVRLRKLTKRFGAKTAVDERDAVHPDGERLRAHRPERRRQDDDVLDDGGLPPADEGTVEVLGFKPSAVDELRSRLGVLPQDALLPANDRVGEFLVHMARLQDYPADKAEEMARQALADVEGSEWWTQRCGSLSHGMAKRVSLAQAFLGEPDVVLLDEPTAGLDPRVAWEMRQLIKVKKGRCTIVISSHNLQELEEILRRRGHPRPRARRRARAR